MDHALRAVSEPWDQQQTIMTTSRPVGDYDPVSTAELLFREKEGNGLSISFAASRLRSCLGLLWSSGKARVPLHIRYTRKYIFNSQI